MIRELISSVRRWPVLRERARLHEAERVIGELTRAHTKELAMNATLRTELAAARSALRGRKA